MVEAFLCDSYAMLQRVIWARAIVVYR